MSLIIGWPLDVADCRLVTRWLIAGWPLDVADCRLITTTVSRNMAETQYKNESDLYMVLFYYVILPHFNYQHSNSASITSKCYFEIN